MEDRIDALSIAQAKPETDLKRVPTTGSLVQLLTQGLQSEDSKMLSVSIHLATNNLFGFLTLCVCYSTILVDR